MVSLRQVRKSRSSYLSTPLMRSIRRLNLTSLAIILLAHSNNSVLQNPDVCECNVKVSDGRTAGGIEGTCCKGSTLPSWGTSSQPHGH